MLYLLLHYNIIKEHTSNQIQKRNGAVGAKFFRGLRKTMVAKKNVKAGFAAIFAEIAKKIIKLHKNADLCLHFGIACCTIHLNSGISVTVGICDSTLHTQTITGLRQDVARRFAAHRKNDEETIKKWREKKYE